MKIKKRKFLNVLSNQWYELAKLNFISILNWQNLIFTPEFVTRDLEIIFHYFSIVSLLIPLNCCCCCCCLCCCCCCQADLITFDCILIKFNNRKLSLTKTNDEKMCFCHFFPLFASTIKRGWKIIAKGFQCHWMKSWSKMEKE